jgi:lipid-A-disaccharide synthase
MNKRHNDYFFYLHATEENKNLILESIKLSNIDNLDVASEENIKSKILSNSVFAVSKSGTVSLQICNSNIPSIIIYKLSFINFLIFKMLVNVRYANIINIINNKEVIPELLQKECNADEIYKSVIYLLKNPELIQKQLTVCSKTLDGIRSKSSSADEASSILLKYLS